MKQNKMLLPALKEQKWVRFFTLKYFKCHLYQWHWLQSINRKWAKTLETMLELSFKTHDVSVTFWARTVKGEPDLTYWFLRVLPQFGFNIRNSVCIRANVATSVETIAETMSKQWFAFHTYIHCQLLAVKNPLQKQYAAEHADMLI